MDEQATDKPFEYRSYSKSELAILYTPFASQKAAVQKLNDWIRTSPGLSDRLRATGLAPYAKRLTPEQVRMIVEKIGHP